MPALDVPKAKLARYFFCETKATDVAMVLFTYFLVAVGYLTIYRNERSQRKLERAYITGGGVTIFNTTFVAQPFPHMQAIVPGDQFQVQVANNGKTPARLTGVWWDFIHFTNPIPNIQPVYGNPQAFDDMIAATPGHRPLFVIDIPPATKMPRPVVIIRYTYLDIWDEPHEARFINEVFRAVPAQIVAPEPYTRLT